jgi:hypothetical protein
MKWLIVAAILAYVGLRVFVYLKPRAPLSRALRRRYLLRTDTQAMSRRELFLSSLSFIVFAGCGLGLYLAVGWGAEELGWRFFNSRPVAVAAKAGLFVGAMALAMGIFLCGVAVFRREAS